MNKKVKSYRGDKPRIYIIDVTNRDGVQTSGINLSKLQKTILNIKLNDMGVYQSEMGFPALGSEKNYINSNLELAEKGVLKPIVLEGWARAVSPDVERAKELCPKLLHMNLSISTSDIMIKGKFGGRINKKDIIDMMAEAVDKAVELGVETIGVNAEDASRTRHLNKHESYLIDFSTAAKEHGADRVRYCDTLGYDSAHTAYQRVKSLAEAVDIPIEIHMHNDIASSVTVAVEAAMGAIDAGVDAYINTTVGGFGERAGNTKLTPVLAHIKHSSGLEGRDVLDPRIDTKKCWDIANYMFRSFGHPIPLNYPVLGANAFSHESGIHVDGQLKDRHMYELYSPEEFGVPTDVKVVTGRKITAGEYSGKKAVIHVFEQLGIDLEDPGRILRLVRYANLLNQKPLTDDELRFIARYPDTAEKLMVVDPKQD